MKIVAAVAMRPPVQGDEGQSMNTGSMADAGLLDTLNGIPKVDIPANLHAAISAGRRMSSILREIVSLRRGAGKLTPNEYFYYRLWDRSAGLWVSWRSIQCTSPATILAGTRLRPTSSSFTLSWWAHGSPCPVCSP